jgi:hypothetical protein
MPWFMGIYGLRWRSTIRRQMAEKSSTWQHIIAIHRFLLLLLLTGGLLVRVQPEEPISNRKIAKADRVVV